MNNKMIDTIYWDMDDVMTDLGGFLEEHFDQPIAQCRYTEPVDLFLKQESKNGLFRALPPSPNLWQIRDAIRWLHRLNYKQYVLTSTGSLSAPGDYRHYGNILANKNTWLIKHLTPPVSALLSSVIFVDHGHQKAQYAKQSALLIDDRRDTCQRFFEAGGNAIQYGIRPTKINQAVHSRIESVTRPANTDEQRIDSKFTRVLYCL